MSDSLQPMSLPPLTYEMKRTLAALHLPIPIPNRPAASLPSPTEASEPVPKPNPEKARPASQNENTRLDSAKRPRDDDRAEEAESRKAIKRTGGGQKERTGSSPQENRADVDTQDGASSTGSDQGRDVEVETTQDEAIHSGLSPIDPFATPSSSPSAARVEVDTPLRSSALGTFPLANFVPDGNSPDTLALLADLPIAEVQEIGQALEGHQGDDEPSSQPEHVFSLPRQASEEPLATGDAAQDALTPSGASDDTPNVEVADWPFPVDEIDEADDDERFIARGSSVPARNLRRDMNTCGRVMKCSKAIMTKGISLYNAVLGTNYKIFGRKKAGAIHAACLFVACRRVGEARTWQEVFKATTEPSGDIRACVATIEDFFQRTVPGTSFQQFQPEQYAMRWMRELEFPEAMIRIAQSTIASCRELDVAYDEGNPPAVAGAVIGFVGHLYGLPKAVKQVEEVTSVPASALKTHYRPLFERQDVCASKRDVAEGRANMRLLPSHWK